MDSNRMMKLSAAAAIAICAAGEQFMGVRLEEIKLVGMMGCPWS